MPSANKPRVLMVLDSIYPKIGGGGAESQVGTLSGYYQSNDIDVRIIAPMVKTGVQKNIDLVDGVNVYRIPYPKLRIVGGLIMLIRLWIFLAKQRNQYDTIHVHIAHKMAAVCCLSGAFHKKNVIVKFTGWLELEHGILSKKTNPFISLLRYSIKKATFYQATSKEIVASIKASGLEEEKINLIPNAVDVTKFTFSGKKANLASSMGFEADLIAVFIGRLVPEKGLNLLIDAWAKNFSDEDKVKLLIVGGGDLEDELKNQVSSLNKNNQIIFLGPQSDVRPYLQVADFGVLPSLFEGLSNTLLEYMASSLPVLGSRVSGTEDMIEHGSTGFLFERGNAIELEKMLFTLSSMQKSEIRSMGENARTAVEKYAGIKAVSSKLLNLYKNSSKQAV